MANLTIVTIDLETYWSQTHSLSKMSPILYCTHPDTEVISIAVKVGTHPTDVLFGEDNIERALNKIDWSDKFVIGHHLSGFDALILAWRFGIKPAMWGCTLAMARPHFAKTVGLSLGKLVEHFGIGEKDQGILLQTKGRRLADFTPEEIDAMRTYNKADTEQCFALFNKLVPMTPKKEMKLIDSTIRMLVEPRFDVDVPLLERTLADEKARMRQVLIDTAAHLNVGGDTEDEVVENVRAALASAPKFSAVLRSFGVDVPMKPSPTNPEKQVPALAKTDEGLLALREHDDPRVAAVVAARLDTKSTILETRLAAYIDVANAMCGKMPIALNYYGGHTGRWSGAFGLNQQNLPRIPRDKDGNIIDKPTNALRMCLKAPKGHKVVVSDLSGIELRVNHFLWKVKESMALYQADPIKADLYKSFAAKLYNKQEADVVKAERQIGKLAQLGLGFSAGAKTFVKIAKTMGGVDITQDESKNVVDSWRRRYREIVDGWAMCGNALAAMLAGEEITVDPWGLCRTEKDAIVLPSGRRLYYPDLRVKEMDDGRRAYVFGHGRNLTFVHPGLVTENIVQAIARDVISDNALEIKRMTGHNVAHTVHDELIYIIPEDEAEEHLRVVQEVMFTPPSWWPELVVSSEGDIADDYGNAK